MYIVGTYTGTQDRSKLAGRVRKGRICTLHRIEQRERKHSIPDNITDTGYYQLSNFLFSLCVSIFYLRRRRRRPVHIERFLWGTQCPLD